jgi:ABC-type nitrate/sulfonate/bicarbonate transport system substrate-binding protein
VTIAKNRPRSLVAFLALIAVMIAACGGGTVAPTATPAGTAAGSAAPGTVVLPKPEKVDVKLGHSALSGVGSGTAILARQLGLYDKYGLKVETVQFSSPAQAMTALLAGQIDMSDQSAAPILATVGTSTPVQIVFVPRANNFDILYSQANIKTAADLRGKTIAISSFGSNSYGGAIYALKALGLTEKDVTLTTVGSDTQRLAALKAGAVAASVQDNTQEKDLNAAGFNSLVRMQDIKPPVGQPGTSIVVPIDFQKKYPNTVMAIVAAQLEAATAARTRPVEELATLYAKELTNIAPEEMRRQIALNQQEPWTPKDGQCRPEDIAFAKTIAVAANPGLANVNELAACNNEFLNKLKDLGLQKKLAIPGY